MILAAGRGKRMRPLTDQLPKPLLRAGDRRLIDWSVDGLVRAGVNQIVINTAHWADIHYSVEGQTYDESLETLGGIAKALPLLSEGEEPFIVVAGDIATDFDFSALLDKPAQRIRKGQLDAHLVLVPNPDFHPEGDMGLVNGLVTRNSRTYTYSSIGLFSPRIFRDVPIVFAKLFPWLDQFIEAGRVSGEVYTGFWENVGTPQALEALGQKFSK